MLLKLVMGRIKPSITVFKNSILNTFNLLIYRFVLLNYRNRLIKTPGIKLLKFSFIPGSNFAFILISKKKFVY
ncbi:hypothetical protein BpHYR1_003792 [Brachionus plicatilis]|uniref:Uncharacterized protein n=1 Tax=Brachionus plicatilis TaxID=10195 RepID=A0A3M7RP25_BRAPC|nr:hypothetical protein BpHYR1_003792 [Brachionus plicatilis]